MPPQCLHLGLVGRSTGRGMTMTDFWDIAGTTATDLRQQAGRDVIRRMPGAGGAIRPERVKRSVHASLRSGSTRKINHDWRAADEKTRMKTNNNSALEFNSGARGEMLRYAAVCCVATDFSYNIWTVVTGGGHGGAPVFPPMQGRNARAETACSAASKKSSTKTRAEFDTTGENAS